MLLLQAKFFTESRLLQRPVKVQILSLPNATATPFQTSATATAPPPASIYIGTGQPMEYVIYSITYIIPRKLFTQLEMWLSTWSLLG